ncbi:GH20234 [Drosophila grimshawi]|uniref:GH20234 n=1 Tax=Drosophila grimshawi TaxID=7222 RepID=B4J5Q1_DROGR|nr:GH20234 [Drosophila grimshawi]
MQPGCRLRASQPARAAAADAGVDAGRLATLGISALEANTKTAAGAASSVYAESTASVATMASISSIASTSASAIATMRSQSYPVAPYVKTASAPPTPHPHAVHNPSSSARTAPATPTRRHDFDNYPQHVDVDGEQEIGLDIAMEEPPLPIQTTTQRGKPKSQRFFWRKALRRVFQRRK